MPMAYKRHYIPLCENQIFVYFIIRNRLMQGLCHDFNIHIYTYPIHLSLGVVSKSLRICMLISYGYFGCGIFLKISSMWFMIINVKNIIRTLFHGNDTIHTVSRYWYIFLNIRPHFVLRALLYLCGVCSN